MCYGESGAGFTGWPGISYPCLSPLEQVVDRHKEPQEKRTHGAVLPFSIQMGEYESSTLQYLVSAPQQSIQALNTLIQMCIAFSRADLRPLHPRMD